ncbi:MAG: TonB-dependent receptor, partial [Muribaculaceae bacterium]|nr:TonB-dependent receptor [Muribaculaceae bacterium]
SVSGVVTDASDGSPIEQALVRLNTLDWAITNDNGEFRFPKLKPGKYQYEISYLGYETAKGEFIVKSKGEIPKLKIALKPSSLALNEVVVTAQESKMGATSSIGQQAIQHLQVKSVEDMLQLLPGALTKNPDLSTAGQATIREIDAGKNANNALGTAVVLDGAPMSNDANLQIFSTARAGNNSSVLQNTMNDQSTSGRGVDLRQVSPDNIESIEVIRGIPSVEYGNLTSGAVIINTKAGATPWSITAKVDPNSRLFSAGKGLRLKNNRGSLNFNVDYTNSNADRRKSYLGYDRVSANIGYSKTFMQSTSPLTFNVKAAYSSNISDTKSDEAMLKGEYFKNTEDAFRLAINGSWRLNRAAISSLNYSASLQYTHQQDIFNANVGSGPVPYSHSYTPGEMVVPFLPSSYMCHYLIDGKPLNVFVQFKGNRLFNYSSGMSNIKLGVEFNYNVNHGGGMIYDAALPPIQGSGQSVRPRSYKDIPGMPAVSAFLEDRTEFNLGSTMLAIQPGVRVSHLFINEKEANRGDITVVDPRINAYYQILSSQNNSIFEMLTINGGYGIASKMPTMASLYPTPAYFDYVNYNSFLGLDNPKNLAVMTTVVVPSTTNPNLKPARANKFEIGLQARVHGVNGSVTFFKEKVNNEFGFVSQIFNLDYNRYVIPQADITPDMTATYRDGAIYYSSPDGEKRALTSRVTEMASYYIPTNDIRTNKHGIEYSINFGRIRPIATEVIVDGAWFWIKRQNMGVSYNSDRIAVGTDENGVQKFNQYFAVLPNGSGSIQSRFNTNFRFVTHIPVIKLLFSTTVQVVWQDSYQNIYENSKGEPLYKKVMSSNGVEIMQVDPIGFYDINMNYNDWNPALVERPDKLCQNFINTYFNKQNYPITCSLNFKLTKEIKDFLELSCIANNFLRFNKVFRQDMIGGY